VTATLRFGAFTPWTLAMGPGKRACLWVAGCPFRCKGCATPEFLEKTSGSDMAVAKVIRMIDSAVRKHGITGMSFSGGEPFAQAEAVAEIARHARKRGLSTLSWSGFTRRRLESVNAPQGASALLAQLDVLIDGVYIANRMEGDPLRGSSNQVIHLLTDRHAPSDFGDQVVDVQCSDKDGAVVVNGVADTRPLRTVLKILGVGSV
jgi:anaerobic ribonucleoside-triphosphate reductase activating protein